jgi:ketosteroid isomerase-like protein
MSQENVEIMRRVNELANTGGWGAVLDEAYHPDAELRDLRHAPDLPEVVRGRDAVRLVLTNWTAAYDDFGAEVYDFIDAHPWVICDTRWYGRGAGSELPIDVRGADAYELKEGRIVRTIIGYADVATALKDLGLKEPGD